MEIYHVDGSTVQKIKNQYLVFQAYKKIQDEFYKIRIMSSRWTDGKYLY